MNYKIRDKYKKFITFLISLVILLVESTMFGFLWIRFYGIDYPVATFKEADNLMILLYAAIMYAFTSLFGGYKFGHLTIMDLIYSQALGMMVTNFITYGVMCLALREIVFPAKMIALCLYEMIFIILYNIFVYMIERKLYPPRKLLLIYGDKGPGEMKKMFGTRKDKFAIIGEVFHEESLDKIKEMMEGSDGVILHRVNSDKRDAILRICYSEDIRAYIVPNIGDIVVYCCGDTHLFDTPVLITKEHGLNYVETIIKRFFDIVMSLVMIVIFSPLMLIIALAVKLYDGGPVIYKQVRVTKNGKRFNIYKFRSMIVDSEKQGARLAGKNDSRITPVGQVIRNLHVDELPQFINVLKGDMSMVGPRPERPEIINKYIKDIPEFNYRLKVKAGLTGYSQVYGRYNTTAYNKLKMDILYIENFSILMDIKILLLTFKILFKKENSEGLPDGQTSAKTK